MVLKIELTTRNLIFTMVRVPVKVTVDSPWANHIFLIAQYNSDALTFFSAFV